MSHTVMQVEAVSLVSLDSDYVGVQCAAGAWRIVLRLSPAMAKLVRDSLDWRIAELERPRL